jgi:acyl carrier protein
LTKQTLPATQSGSERPGVPSFADIITGIEDAIAVDRPRRDLRATDRIRENLRLDSLALLELLTRIEERFGIELIEHPGVYSANTVGELVELIRSELIRSELAGDR